MQKILIVDDNPNALLRMKTLLEHEGFEIEDYSNFGKALDWLKQPGNKPDLALLDIVDKPKKFGVPPEELENYEPQPDDYGGFKIAEAVKKIDKNIPIIFFSGYHKIPDIKSKAKEFEPIVIFPKGGTADIDDIDTDTGIKIKEAIQEVFEKRRKRVTNSEYYSKATFGKFRLKGEATMKIKISEEDFEVTEDCDFLIEIHDIIYAQSQGGHLMLKLANIYQSVVISNVNAESFNRQMSEFCRANNMMNPFVKGRGSTYINENLIKYVDYDSSVVAFTVVEHAKLDSLEIAVFNRLVEDKEVCKKIVREEVANGRIKYKHKIVRVDFDGIALEQRLKDMYPTLRTGNVY